jgi:hypothetical protein
MKSALSRETSFLVLTPPVILLKNQQIDQMRRCQAATKAIPPADRTPISPSRITESPLDFLIGFPFASFSVDEDPWLLLPLPLLLLPLVPEDEPVEVPDDEVSVSSLPPTTPSAVSLLLAPEVDVVEVSLSAVGEDANVDAESADDPVAVEALSLSLAVDSESVPVSPGQLVVELFGS